MIITKKLKIKTTNKNIAYYNNIGFNVKSGDIIEIDVNDLPITSKEKVEVQCDNCLGINNILYFSYLRNIKNENLYYCKKCSNIRFKKTSIEKYGVEHPLKNEDIKNKLEKTNIEKYGFKCSLQNEEIKIKVKKTNLIKYDTEFFINSNYFKIKSEETLLEKYGTTIPLHNEEIKNKLKVTNLKRYGNENLFKSDVIKEKIKKIKLERYNNINYNNRKKYKQTCLNKYGMENPMQNEKIKNKLKNIIFEKYGVNYPAQNIDIYNKMIAKGFFIKEYKQSGIYYQGKYELDFLEKYYEYNIISKHLKIDYIYNNNNYSYYPDFFVEKLNLIVEIKSSYWYNFYLEKNLAKEKACKEQGFNFIFIIDKNYDIFNKLIKNIIYDKEHSWQYDIRLKTLETDLININFDITKLKITDFKFEYVPKFDNRTKDIVNFIKKYEWLGTMPNRPTHRFIATYNNIIAGVIIMSTPNSFSKILGENTKNIEKLISRGACVSWAPKNLASSMLMWSINWMVKNTEFRLFCAYADPNAKELGTIYQACNFYYLGNNFGSDKLYLDPLNTNSGWVNNRRFRKLNFYKSYLKSIEVKWNDNWNRKTTILWNNIPNEIIEKMKKYSDDCLSRCYMMKTPLKHKYLYILGRNKAETKALRKQFENSYNYKEYPKNR